MTSEKDKNAEKIISLPDFIKNKQKAAENNPAKAVIKAEAYYEIWLDSPSDSDAATQALRNIARLADVLPDTYSEKEKFLDTVIRFHKDVNDEPLVLPLLKRLLVQAEQKNNPMDKLACYKIVLGSKFANPALKEDMAVKIMIILDDL